MSAAGYGILLLDDPKADIPRLCSHYVYCTLNAVAGRPLFAERFTKQLITSYTALYGETPAIVAADFIRETAQLFAGANNSGNGTADVFLCPPRTSSERPLLVLARAGHVFDPGYSLSGLRARGVIANYDIPFRTHLTAVSRAAARYCDDYALRRGAHTAVRADRSGNLVSCGDHPLAAARGRRIIVPPDESGRPGAEREILLELCRISGAAVSEEPLPVESLDSVDELLVMRPEGLLSVLECSGRWFYNTAAQMLEKYLPELTDRGLTE